MIQIYGYSGLILCIWLQSNLPAQYAEPISSSNQETIQPEQLRSLEWIRCCRSQLRAEPKRCPTIWGPSNTAGNRCTLKSIRHIFLFGS